METEMTLLISQFVNKTDRKKRIKVINVGYKVNLGHYAGLLTEKILLLRMEVELTIKNFLQSYSGNNQL